MALEAVIFDLDLTLIASAASEPLRRKRMWPEVYELIPQLTPFEGITALLRSLAEHNVKIAVVTSSPASYCGKVLKYWRWPFTTMVCYHDTVQKKPHPAPMLKALENMQVTPEAAVAVGDMPADIASAKAANIFAIAALWGLTDSHHLLEAQPNLSCATVAELTAYIDSRLTR